MQKRYTVNGLPYTVLPPPSITNHCQEVHVKKEAVTVTENSDDDINCNELSEPYTNDEDVVKDNIVLDVCSKMKLTETKQNFEEKEVHFERKEILVEEKETNFEEIYIEGHEVNTRATFCSGDNKQLINIINLGKYTPKYFKKKPIQACSKCSETFTNKKNLASHISRTHRSKNIVPMEFYCDQCTKICIKRKSFLVHLRQHRIGRTHICTVCDKAFYEKVNLIRHVKIHTGEKPYTCEICSKTFIQKAHLKLHMKVHRNGRKYTQYTCRNVHSGQKPSCDICKKEFYSKRTLIKHMKVHTCERPYPCKLCDKAYIVSHSLKKHMKTHLVVKNNTKKHSTCLSYM